MCRQKTTLPEVSPALLLAFLLNVFLLNTSLAQTQYTFTPIVRSGQNGITDLWTFPVINNSGRVAFAAGLDSLNVAVFTGTGGTLTPIKSDPEGKLVYAINDLGRVLYRTDRIFASDGTSSSEIISLAEMAGNLWPDMNNDATDTVAWTGRQGSVYGIYKKSAGLQPQLIANGSLFYELYFTSINDQGVVAFGARSLNDPNTFLVVKGNGSSSQTLGETSIGVILPQINNSGKVAFAGRVTSPGFPDTMGVYIHDGQTLNLVDTTSALTGSQQDTVSINDNDQIVYRKPFNGGIGLFTGPGAIVIAPGTGIDGHVISAFDDLVIGPNAINNQGQITFWVRFNDGSPAAIYRADPVSPNNPPVLAHIGSRTVKAGITLAFTASATDPDFPPNTLTFSLDSGSPSGATIDATTGNFSWTPSNKQGPMGKQESVTYPITIRVTDNGSPARSASEAIVISVTKKGGKN